MALACASPLAHKQVQATSLKKTFLQAASGPTAPRLTITQGAPPLAHKQVQATSLKKTFLQAASGPA